MDIELCFITQTLSHKWQKIFCQHCQHLVFLTLSAMAIHLTGYFILDYIYLIFSV